MTFSRNIKIAPSILSADFANFGAECRAIEAVRQTPLMISLVTPTGHWLMHNPAAEALYGIPRRAFNAGEMQLMHFVHPEDREAVSTYYRSLVDDEFGEMQYRIISSNGRIKWVHDEGHLVYCTTRSIRRRRSARRSDERSPGAARS